MQALLDGVDAVRQLAGRASEFAQALLEHEQLVVRVQAAADNAAAAQAAHLQAEEQHKAAHLVHATLKLEPLCAYTDRIFERWARLQASA